MTECEKFKGRLRDLCEGRGLNGRKNPPAHAVKAFREANGIADPQPEWDVSKPPRGLGDVVKKLTHATGIDKVVEAVAGKKGCGCAKRQADLNAAFPFAGPQP